MSRVQLFRNIYISGDSIQVWIQSLSDIEREYFFYWPFLSTEEKIIASRFVHDLHRIRYVLSHGILHIRLSEYLNIKPERIGFIKNQYGKPFVVVDNKPCKIEFSLSHSQDMLLIGITDNKSIGVDIEVWDDGFDHKAVIDFCLSPLEKNSCRDLTDHENKKAFYRFWTRKESFLKAVGLGLNADLTEIVTAIDGAVEFLSIPNGFGSVHDWQFIDLDLGQNVFSSITKLISY